MFYRILIDPKTFDRKSNINDIEPIEIFLNQQHKEEENEEINRRIEEQDRRAEEVRREEIDRDKMSLPEIEEEELAIEEGKELGEPIAQVFNIKRKTLKERRIERRIRIPKLLKVTAKSMKSKSKLKTTEERNKTKRSAVIHLIQEELEKLKRNEDTEREKLKNNEDLYRYYVQQRITGTISENEEKQDKLREAIRESKLKLRQISNKMKQLYDDEQTTRNEIEQEYQNETPAEPRIIISDKPSSTVHERIYPSPMHISELPVAHRTSYSTTSPMQHVVYLSPPPIHHVTTPFQLSSSPPQ